MADAKDTKPRTFVKNTHDGKTLTRTVTGPASEVAARFDGFEPESGSTKPAASKPAAASS